MNCKHRPPTRCKCVDHHPGLGYVETLPAPSHTTLRVITLGAQQAAPMRDEHDVDAAVRERRELCSACNGDPVRCQEGTGAPHFRRLAGCTAFGDDGSFEAIHAAPQPRQPWEPRPARRRAA